MPESLAGKPRITISLDRRFLDWVDEKVNERIFASRSHAIEFAIKRLMEEEKAKKM